MALSPAAIRALQFTTVKRGGYDQREVESFRTSAADALEGALQESTAMEARARAAVARLQELSQQPAAPEPPPQAEVPAPPPAPVIAIDEAEMISRTLLLAQRTADTAIAEAEVEATRIIEQAKADSRKAGEAERVRVEGEVQALLARRDFLESDVDQLEQHIAAQRERITEVVGELEALTNRVPNGLGAMRRPQLSASDHALADDAASASPNGPDSIGYADADEDEADVAALIDQVAESAEGPDPADRDADGRTLFSTDDPR